MANREATATLRLAGDTAPLALPTIEIIAPYMANMGGDLDVPDLTASSTSFDVPFGSIAEATHVQVKNDTGQDVAIRVGGASVSGVLASGTVTIAFAAVPGERLSVEMTTSGGTPGVLSVKRSSGNVIVQSWLSGTGIQTADSSTVKVYNNAPPIIADGGAVVVSSPAAGSGVTSAQVILTDTQAGAGTIETGVFGDPT